MRPATMGSQIPGLEMPLHPHNRADPQQQRSNDFSPFPAQHQHESPDADAAKRGGGPQAPSPSPWHRMKWTDSMVRLLIMIVYCMGDDNTAGAEEEHKGKKSPMAAGQLMLQKKGKWKSVSRAMMEKGFYVSPQQCEDKFNDLNKRYKRVNELLGKGTACRVVENQALLDSLDIPPKAKEEAKKLLNSKHLFFREMCAYHNGGGAASSSACSAPHPPQTAAQPTPLRRSLHDEDDEEEEEAEEDYCDDDDDDEEEEEEEREVKRGKGTPTSYVSPSPPLSLSLSTSPAGASMQQLRSELASVGGEQQQRQWLKRKAAELEEQRLGYQRRALELEKQKFKWMKFSAKKEREMEKMELRNQRLRLENDRMLLLLRQKEKELMMSANSGVTSQFSADHLRPNLLL